MQTFSLWVINIQNYQLPLLLSATTAYSPKTGFYLINSTIINLLKAALVYNICLSGDGMQISVPAKFNSYTNIAIHNVIDCPFAVGLNV